MRTSKQSALVLLVNLALFVSAAPLLATLTGEISSVRKTLSEAYTYCQVDSKRAENLYQKAFHQAMELTRPQLKSRFREEALYLASKCLHPTLFVEVRLAIETYLSLFPKGRHITEVLIQKGLLDYAEGKFSEAEKAFERAAESTQNQRLQKKIETLQFHGLMYSKRYRTAREFLNKLCDSRKPTRKMKNDMRRFEDGERELLDSLNMAKYSTYSSSQEINFLKKCLENRYFADSAPEAALLVVSKEDELGPFYRGATVEWLGLPRTSVHGLLPHARIERLKKFLSDYPEADLEMVAIALLEISSIYLHELKDPENSEIWLKYLRELPGYAERADLEYHLRLLVDARLDSPQSQQILKKVASFDKLFPYDNGWIVPITRELVNELRIYSGLFNGDKDEAKLLVGQTPIEEKIRGIPAKVFLFIAADLKDAAFNLYKNEKNNILSQDRKMIEDFLFPLYEMTYPRDLRLFASIAISQKWPKIAIDNFLKYLTSENRPLFVEHAMAFLSELYLKHRSYIEAQSVWSTLRELFPRSVWTK